ncbi:hypothetical protein AGMMS49574_17560 [Bacteroidia bacterium]|nr:hypothetical protein AGMMS49574_17560 [Bacteroidia bacterium]
MTFEIGSILFVKDYQLPTKIKNKFFIVIGISDGDILLLSMTTSQLYFDESLIKHGVIIDRDMSVYCFEQNRMIGRNGFAFRKNTFISHRANIHAFNSEKLDSLNIEYIDCLIKEEIIELIYSFYKRTPPKYTTIFERILSMLSE